mgnify:CR=1 FL=1
MQMNYRKNCMTLRDYILEGGIKGKIFVDIHNGSKPYIITAVSPLDHTRTHNPFSHLSIFNHINIIEVCSQGSSRGGCLLDHLGDPEYYVDASNTTEYIPSHWKVDPEQLEKELSGLAKTVKMWHIKK